MASKRFDRADVWAIALHTGAVLLTVSAVCFFHFTLEASLTAALLQVYVMLIVLAVSAPELLLASVGRSEIRELVKETFKFPRSGQLLLGFLLFCAAFTVGCEAFRSATSGRPWWLARVNVVAFVAGLSATLLSILFYIRNLTPEAMSGQIAMQLEKQLNRVTNNEPEREERQEKMAKCFRNLATLGRAARTQEELRAVLQCFETTITEIIRSPGYIGDSVMAKSFRNLATLGRAARTREELRAVLQCFETTITEIIRSATYRGDSLEVAIREMVDTITGNSRLTVEPNLVAGLDRLERVKKQIRASAKKGPDLQRIREAHQRFARFVLGCAIENPQGRFMEVLSSALWSLDKEPTAQFTLLRMTLDINQPIVWTAVVVRLRGQYQDEADPVQRRERRVRMLGFAAMLRQKGRAEERWVEEQIVSALEEMDIAQAVNEAHGWMYHVGEFRVADALALWHEALGELRNPGPVTRDAPLISLSFSLLGGS